jgi:hypothetical protein
MVSFKVLFLLSFPLKTMGIAIFPMTMVISGIILFLRVYNN